MLQVEGTVSPSSGGLTLSARTTLLAHFQHLDEYGRADPTQRLGVEDLAQLAGLTIGDLPEALPVPSEGQDLDVRKNFIEQLSMEQDPVTVKAVLTVLD